MSRKIAFGSLGLLLLISPLVASAATLAELRAQLDELLARISSMQPTNTPLNNALPDDYGTAPTSSCPRLTVTLQRGSRDIATGGQVSELQLFLANKYNLNDDDVVTGYFGAMTEQYVKRYQGEKNLPTLGIVGSLTRAAIAMDCRPQPTQCPAVQQPECPNGTLVSLGTNANGCSLGYRCESTKKPTITIKSPSDGSTYSIANSIPMTWTASNVIRKNTQVILKLEGVNVSGGVSGGTWQSKQLNAGQTTQTHNWQTGDGYLTATGKYKLTAYMIACEPQGCDYNYDSQAGLGRERIATSNSVYFTIASTTSIATPTVKLTISKPTVQPGESTVVSWTSTNATRCWVKHGPLNGSEHEETIALQGSKQFNPYVDFKVTVGCANEPYFPKDGLTTTANTIIMVAVPPAPATRDIMSDTSWKMTTGNPGSVWTQFNYNDSGWQTPTDQGQYDPNNGPWANNVVGFPTDSNARWDPLESTCRHASLSIL